MTTGWLNRLFSRLAAVCCLFWFAVGPVAAAEPDRPVARLLATAYPAGEVLHYNVTWMGLTAGRLTLEVRQLDGPDELFAIKATARTAGLLGAIYPVRDDFLVVVRGEQRLPDQYRIDQHQGERHNVRITMYDQPAGRVIYQRNQEEPLHFEVDGPVYNEFSAFYAMRAMPLGPDRSVVVPTFADRQRHEVPVVVERLETINSMLGRLETMRVRPQLKFAGLYDKAGDPLVWLTNDQYRVPLRIRSRLTIGSLTATLAHYQGPRPVE